jgi:hypothetical protein
VKATIAVGGRLDLAGSAEERQQHRIKQEGLGQLMSHRTSWETPRGRYDKHRSKFSLSMKPMFNRPVKETTSERIVWK